MKLLVFAHRGEAQSFFNEWDFVPVDFYFSGLFKSKNYFLLVTGEGPKDASEKTVATLSSFKESLSQVINIGIAGSLCPKLKIGDLAWVRSSYAQNAEKCEFKSYTTKNHSNVDCITVNTRITKLQDRQNLSAFADIVDREFWSIASAAHLFKIEVLSLKLISDDIQSTDMCQLIKDEAPAFSRKLLKEFQDFENKNKALLPAELHAPKPNTIENFLLIHPKFYFTTSQSRKLTTLLRGLSLKKLLNDEDIKHIIARTIEAYAADKTPKELSKILIQDLSEKLNPLNTKIKEKINQSLKPLLDSGASVSFDPELEQDYIQINYQIRNTKDQKRLMLSLEQFNYQKIKEIFAGNLGDDV